MTRKKKKAGEEPPSQGDIPIDVRRPEWTKEQQEWWNKDLAKLVMDSLASEEAKKNRDEKSGEGK